MGDSMDDIMNSKLNEELVGWEDGGSNERDSIQRVDNETNLRDCMRGWMGDSRIDPVR